MFSLIICDKGPKKAKEKDPIEISINRCRKAAWAGAKHGALLQAFRLT